MKKRIKVYVAGAYSADNELVRHVSWFDKK